MPSFRLRQGEESPFHTRGLNLEAKPGSGENPKTGVYLPLALPALPPTHMLDTLLAPSESSFNYSY